MIDIHTAPTINGHRAVLALLECGLEHRRHQVDLVGRDQRSPGFLALNPSGTIPVLVDSDGPGNAPITVTQSAAIVLYCAEKAGALIPGDARRRVLAYEWFAHAMTDMGTASSILFQTSLAPDGRPANDAFFQERFLRHCANLDRRLAQREFLADELSIADIALYPIVAARAELIDGAPGLGGLKNWKRRMAERPAVSRAMSG